MNRKEFDKRVAEMSPFFYLSKSNKILKQKTKTIRVIYGAEENKIFKNELGKYVEVTYSPFIPQNKLFFAYIKTLDINGEQNYEECHFESSYLKEVLNFLHLNLPFELTNKQLIRIKKLKQQSKTTVYYSKKYTIGVKFC